MLPSKQARSLIEYSTGYAVLSTLSKKNPGFPAGSVVGFALDAQGLPFFAFSTMSGHTQDLLQNVKGAPAALTVTANGFKGAADARVTLVGSVSKVDGDEIKPLRDLYLQKHTNAFWVDFGDFKWFHMKTLQVPRLPLCWGASRVDCACSARLRGRRSHRQCESPPSRTFSQDIRFIGGFGRAGDIAPEVYVETKPDPIQATSAAIFAILPPSPRTRLPLFAPPSASAAHLLKRARDMQQNSYRTKVVQKSPS